MSVLHKVMPSRDAAKPMKIIIDLDAICIDPIGFRFQGKDFFIHAAKAGEGFEIIKAVQDYHEFYMQFAQSSDLTREQVLEAYYNCIHTFCPEITLIEIESMQVSQLKALMREVTKYVIDQSDLGEEEKKNLLDQIKLMTI